MLVGDHTRAASVGEDQVVVIGHEAWGRGGVWGRQGRVREVGQLVAPLVSEDEQFRLQLLYRFLESDQTGTCLHVLDARGAEHSQEPQDEVARSPEPESGRPSHD